MKDMFQYLLDDVGSDGEYEVIPELERVPNEKQAPVSVREDVLDAANTAALMDLLDNKKPTPDIESSERAAAIFEQAREPTTHERQLPGVMLKLNAMLTEYDHKVIRDADQVRLYVTNRLIEETDDPDPKIRLKAYELLGKVSDVGLFTEKKEVTIKHQSDEDLEAALRSKLSILIDGEVEDVTEEKPALLTDVSAEDLIDKLTDQ